MELHHLEQKTIKGFSFSLKQAKTLLKGWNMFFYVIIFQKHLLFWPVRLSLYSARKACLLGISAKILAGKGTQPTLETK